MIVSTKIEGKFFLVNKTAFSYGIKLRSKQLKDRTLKGLKPGEDFGFSVAACDINGDGRDDLVVGAPSYAEDQYHYNVGRVHIFVFNKNADSLQQIESVHIL